MPGFDGNPGYAQHRNRGKEHAAGHGLPPPMLVVLDASRKVSFAQLLARSTLVRLWKRAWYKALRRRNTQ